MKLKAKPTDEIHLTRIGSYSQSPLFQFSSQMRALYCILFHFFLSV